MKTAMRTSSSRACLVRLHSVPPAALTPCRRSRSQRSMHMVARSSAGPNPAQLAEMMKNMQANPEAAAQAMQKAMEDPAMRAQMESMASAMQNQALQTKLAQLKDDPEFAEMFDDLAKNGMQALMKYYNDPKWLAKLGSKLDGVAPEQPQGARPRPPPQAVPDEITNLLDAAKYEDDEAVEDFIAIGKDVNAADSEGRTPLHFAAGTNNEVIAVMLIEAGANMEAVDSKSNTPLHYAAGYGREEMTRLLLSRGVNVSARNGTGKTAGELVRAAPPNPLNKEADLMAKLQ